MSNEVIAPAQSSAPATPVVAPGVAPAMVAAAPVVKALPKPSHTRLYILLAVFAVMGGALAAVSFLKPGLVTSTFAWVTKTSMHAAPSESRVLVNGQWVTTSKPEAELIKEKKPVVPNVLKTSVEVVAPEAVAPATSDNASAPTAPSDEKVAK